ncbi:MAG: substrate-binding domain-containing protein [Thiotrichales bacterium]|nr:MAG: substrate-binding domain-containing protein [Thiotrichales bacterium]
MNNTDRFCRHNDLTVLRSALSIFVLAISLLYLRTGFSDSALTVDDNRILRLATTTSTDNSGLLSYMLPVFEQKTGYRVHVIAVGTGKALRMGRDGDADVLLVHAPGAEIEFVKAGHGVKRHAVMYNDFVLVGPSSETAGHSIGSDIHEALQQIAAQKLTFISRGDNSGTHKKELGLWNAVDISPEGRWYREVGQGMGKVLQIASELDAYTLTDRGTWLAYQDKSPLVIINQDDARLYNPYHIIAVNPSHVDNINNAGAQALIDWITSESGQSLIGSYTINDHLLFKPSAGPRQLSQSGDP